MDEQLSGGLVVSRRPKMVEKFVVAYAKITTDKEGIALQGVYFGGMGNTLEEAEEIARDCVNTVRGGTILPKVVEIGHGGQILDALYEASDRFEQTTASMQEAQKIISRTQTRNKK
jgi:hypothetical protein